MGKKITVKTKTTVSQKGKRQPVKPDMSPDSSVLTEKIVIVVNKNKNA